MPNHTNTSSATITTTGDVSTLLTDSTSDLLNATSGAIIGPVAYPEIMSEFFSASPDAIPVVAPTDTLLDLDLPTMDGEAILTGMGFASATHGTISDIQFIADSAPFALDIHGSATWTQTGFSAMHATSFEVFGPGGDVYLKGNILLDTNNFSGTITEEKISANGLSIDVRGQIDSFGGGAIRTITVDDGAGDTIAIQGHLPTFAFGDAFSSSSTIADFVTNSALLEGNDTINIGMGGVAVHGWDGNDHLNGGANADTLDGGAGNDVMKGGLGDDTYYVDSGQDTIIEKTGEGHDLVFASADYRLGANVEDLTLGAGGLHGTGNSLANTITGSADNDVIDGGANSIGNGADVLIGGAGDDTYIIHGFGEVIMENSGEGNDTVIADFSSAHNATSIIDLASDPQLANVENVTISGHGLFNINGDTNANVLIGNRSVNVISGNDGDDFLQGGFGADTLTGGAGADTFSYGAGEGHSSSNADLITDFTTGLGGDALDIQNLISGYHPGVSALSDFVHATQVGGDTIISVASGHHGHFTDIATLQGVTNVDLNQMILDGNLLIAPPN